MVEAHDHASCYTNYTRNKKEAGGDGGREYDENDVLYEIAEKAAYEELFDRIGNVIIPNKTIVPVASLTERLDASMSRQEQALKTSARKNMRRRLESQFMEAIHIFPNGSGKLLLVPQSITVQDVVLENQNLSRELKVWKTILTDANKIIDQASSQIRDKIKTEMKATS